MLLYSMDPREELEQDLQIEDQLVVEGITHLNNVELKRVAMRYGLAQANTNMMFSRVRILRDLSCWLGL